MGWKKQPRFRGIKLRDGLNYMNPLSALPQIETILNHASITRWIPRLSRPLVVQIARDTLEAFRRDFTATSSVPEVDRVVQAVDASCISRSKRRLCRVINATGVIIHTNLGRSPISTELWRAAEPANTGYTNLEIDLESGKRGHRGGIIPELLALLTGAESGLLVNNGAAALYLILSCFATGSEVIVSRGEQVQIGGGFRIPEILSFSGAKLAEIGTTNVCTVADYLGAVGEQTAMALLVHTSNFSIRGFTSKPSPAALRSALPDNVLLVVDQGSGAIDEEIPDERKIREYLRDGADLVCFSSDKLIEGPQGGCIVGKADLIRKLSKHQLMRIVRPGKTVYSLLEEHLISTLNGSDNSAVGKKLAGDDEAIRKRCLSVQQIVGENRVAIAKSTMVIGGGSAPGAELPSWSLRIIDDRNPVHITSALRDRQVPIIATTRNDSVVLDLGTVDETDLTEVADAILTLSTTDG